LGILYILAISSLGIYGIIIAGWASNSRYAFFGALRSVAQMICLEIIIYTSKRLSWIIIEYAVKYNFKFINKIVLFLNIDQTSINTQISRLYTFSKSFYTLSKSLKILVGKIIVYSVKLNGYLIIFLFIFNSKLVKDNCVNHNKGYNFYIEGSTITTAKYHKVYFNKLDIFSQEVYLQQIYCSLNKKQKINGLLQKNQATIIYKRFYQIFTKIYGSKFNAALITCLQRNL